MNLSYRIAIRYFFSRNKRSFISVIARIAMAGVAVGTMAMVVVLSVFNGMEDLNRNMFKTFDPDAKITPKQGRRMSAPATLLTKIRSVEGVQLVTRVIEDNALARYGNQQTLVRVKGVDENFAQRGQLDTALIEGSLQLKGPNGTPFAVVAAGVKNALTISTEDFLTPLELWYPRTGSKTININSTEAFNQVLVRPGGVFFIESRYDDYVIAPLDVVTSLLQYGDKVSALEIKVKPGYSGEAVSEAIADVIGNQYVVKDRDSMNADLLRAIRIEKLFVAVTLSLIILVAAINIFFSLSMLAIEKKNDISMLYALGATPSLIRKIFLTEGAIVALSGAVTGLLLGTGLCWLQIRYGLVSMGMATSLVDAYPVKIIPEDIFFTGIMIVIVTLTVSYVPAVRATKAGKLTAG
jgi:lipoprotein-releasing system permease protein